ncbi:MAG: hypothetical protein COA69_01610 [Robiginitomaculum sp.]|nr:MAG: hypothetical protein COA69_01610 [Robiginitomaculum sp.]
MSDFNQSQSVAKAIHSALAANLGVQALLGDPARLYDHAPENPIYPYLSYGPMRSEDTGGDAHPVTTHSLTLHIWSRYSGRAEVMQCLSAVSEALEEGGLTLSSAHLISAHTVFSDSFRAPDGRTLHGLLRFNVTTEPI